MLEVLVRTGGLATASPCKRELAPGRVRAPSHSPTSAAWKMVVRLHSSAACGSYPYQALIA